MANNLKLAGVWVVALGVWVGVASVSADAQSSSEAKGGLTYSKDVAPIFYAKCVACHRPGEAAPMSLIAYKDVRPWVAAIRQRVAARLMPPWPADHRYGEFKNDRSLSDKQIETIVSWAKEGAPEGNPADLPNVPKFAPGWQIGTPDIVFSLPEDFDVPAKATIDYQHFEVATNFTEDRWISAAEIRAGDRAHIHHVIVNVVPPQGVAGPASSTFSQSIITTKQIIPDGQTASPRVPRQVQDPNSTHGPGSPLAVKFGHGYALANWAPGEDPPVYPVGTAKRVPAGSTLIFQVHYTTNGTPGKDGAAGKERTKVGLIFAKEPPRKELVSGVVINNSFAIPPGAPDHQVESEATFTQDVEIYTLHPHMHLRGKDMTYTVTYPDGRSEILLQVPKYELAWQTDFYLKEPLLFPKGTKLRITAHYDNSANNPFNPDPTAIVRWGDQTWEEMMGGFFTYTTAGPVKTTTAQVQR